MQCEKAREHFTDYLSDSLADDIRSDMQQHLIGCESCREEAEALRESGPAWARFLQTSPIRMRCALGSK